MESSGRNSTFHAIGTVPGAINTYTSRNYTFLDKNPDPGTNYYRLKQIDIDGQYSYSKIIAVHNKSASKDLVFPNPARDFVTVTNDTQSPSLILLIDGGGRVIKSWKVAAGVGSSLLQLGEFAAGHYQLQWGSDLINQSVTLIIQ